MPGAILNAGGMAENTSHEDLPGTRETVQASKRRTEPGGDLAGIPDPFPGPRC